MSKAATIGEIVLLNPRCTWGDLAKRAHRSDGKGFRQIQAEWIRREKMLKRLKKASKRKKAR